MVHVLFIVEVTPENGSRGEQRAIVYTTKRAKVLGN
jgi:hypothetical protein